MITHEDGRLRALAEDGRWPELLAAYRQGRAAAVVEAGEEAAAALTAPLGHLIAYAAPPELAVRLFDGDGGAGTAAGVADHDAGPLWEVLATRHSWLRLAPLLGPSSVRRLVAHTRALLGEDLSYGAEPDPEGVPLRLEPWEAAGWDEGVRVREYLPGGGARSALLTLPASREGLGEVELPPAARSDGRPGGPRVTRALTGLGALAPWAETACVRGQAPAAAALVARDRWVVGGYLPFALAYPALVRAAAVGRAQGCAHGRLGLWRALAAMAGADGPEGAEGVDRGEVNALVARMRCFTWQEPSAGLHHLHVALEDPASGVAWVVSGSQEL
ncbi:hypothetical protein [Kitasatospora sp. NPDC001547]|uniref:hypothetical protein n=1 Tax=Kitasatospora sp. NPDC001547 TaxID=3364015 RepID=UPI003676E55C|nr:hypothetical protein KitaXyl93_58350 [Kitasatospora sp. Xyl93]